ncbi:MAG: DHH family phosphoesterase [Thaumarchaeota archaeon]|nr:DHH family phosphoesterase [Nitrososphaerota archaeon]
MSSGAAAQLLPEPGAINRAAVLCHMHADPDTYLSAYALRFLISRYAPNALVDIIIPEGMSVVTQRLAKSFPNQEPSPESAGSAYDLIVAVDIGDTELLKDWNEKLRESSALKVLIDHHPIKQDSPYNRSLVDTSASSAAELVYSLFKAVRVEPDSETAQALLTGILFDSQNLAIAGEGALRTVLELISFGAVLEKARTELRSPPDYGEVIAKFKAAKRVKVYRASGWVIAVSTVGSFQANVARSFVNMGADIALVAGESSKETRGSLRASHRFYAGTKVHVGTDIAAVLSKETGYGGGHPTAASLTCGVSEEDLIRDFLALMGRLLGEPPTEVK